MPTYVALGSSFASGPGIEPIIDPACGRSGNNYAHLVAARLGHDLIDVTSGGATVDDVLSRSQSLMAGGSVAPQIDAVVPGADLVTVTVGGNDVEYLPTLLRCSYRADPDGAPAEARAFFGSAVDRGAVDVALAALPGALARVVASVRQRAPRARIVLVDYLTVLPESGDGGAAAPMSDADRRFCADLGRRLARATEAAARTTGADLVQASAASVDHHACSADPWVTGWQFGDVLAGGVAPYHPNAAGMRAVAELILRLLGRAER